MNWVHSEIDVRTRDWAFLTWNDRLTQIYGKYNQFRSWDPIFVWGIFHHLRSPSADTFCIPARGLLEGEQGVF